ncbi:MAG: hypothetical protein JKY65_31460 [Planctomycetes bacterium]|nr:hypothetical protein [Planctomycetota bacterium]
MAGGGEGNTWIYALVGGSILAFVGMGLHGSHVGPGWLSAALLAIGGLSVVFGSCESMIKSVEGLGKRLGWNEFVAGTMAGLASNIPEIVMLGFVVKANPRVAFVVVMLTLHVGAMAFGLYCGLLPRDARGAAKLPAPLVKLSTDLYACAGGMFLAMGFLMIVIHGFGPTAGTEKTPALIPSDLYMIGACLLMVEVVAVVQLVKNYAGTKIPTAQDTALAEVCVQEGSALAATGVAKAIGEVTPAALESESAPEPTAEAEASAPSEGEAAAAEKPPAPPEESAPANTPHLAPDHDCDPTTEEEIPSWGQIAFYGLVGIGTSVIGGHAVGEFAEILVEALTERGVSEMVGAIILSVFACAGVFAMIGMAHAKGKFDIALSGASGAVSQVPFVVLPIVLFLIAVFNQTGVTPPLPDGGALAIDLETTSVVIFGFPTMLMMWKSIQDDGQINWVETASMMSLFGVILYFLAVHG